MPESIEFWGAVIDEPEPTVDPAAYRILVPIVDVEQSAGFIESANQRQRNGVRKEALNGNLVVTDTSIRVFRLAENKSHPCLVCNRIAKERVTAVKGVGQRKHRFRAAKATSR